MEAALKPVTKSQIIRERWLRGRLDYKLHAGQKLIRASYRTSQSQLFVGECSRQFGKSYLLVLEAIETAIQKKRARIKYGTAFLTDLAEFILPTFEAILEDCPEDLRPKYKTQGSKWVFPNKAEIKLVGLDRKPNGLRGNVIDLIVLDEAGFMSRLDYLYKSVIIPATTHRPNCRILVFSTPPETPAHEFLDYVQKAQLEGGHCQFTIYDNPMVDETTIARLMKESGGAQSTTWRREYLCEHITDANLAIISDWLDDYIEDVKKDVYSQFYHKYKSMDLGVRDHTAVIFGHYDFLKAQLKIEGEFIINGPEMNTKILQANLKRKELEVWSEYEFKKEIEIIKDEEDIKKIEEDWKDKKKPVYMSVSDNNNPLLLQDLSFLHQLHFVPTDKGRLEEMVNTVKIMTRSGGIRVDPKCKQLIGCLKYGVWNKNRDEFARSNVFGHFDALAALIYLVRNLNKTTNPIPVGFQVELSEQIIVRRDRVGDTSDTLKSAFGLNKRR